MQVSSITQVVGKLGLDGLYQFEPMNRKKRAKTVQKLIDANRQWDVRIRTNLGYTDPDVSNGPMSRHLRAARKGLLEVPMKTTYQRRNRRAVHTAAKPVTTRQEFKAGTIYEVGTQLACMLLNPDHWGQIFEEVPRPYTPKNPLGIKSRKDAGESSFETDQADTAPDTGGIGPV